jgi:hypothetical protein
MNALIPPHPTLLDPTWSFVNDRVEVSTAFAYPRLGVMSVVENTESTLAPLLG